MHLKNVKELCHLMVNVISLKTIILDDDEIPTGYLCYDISNWDFSGKRLIVSNPDENVHKYSLPFK